MFSYVKRFPARVRERHRLSVTSPRLTKRILRIPLIIAVLGLLAGILAGALPSASQGGTVMRAGSADRATQRALGGVPAPDDALGSAVAASGSTVVLGAPGVNRSAGAAYVYSHLGGRWHLQAALNDPTDVPGDSFGSAVAISGNTLLIAAQGPQNVAGTVYVYTWSRGQWSRQETLSDPDRSAADEFGWALAVSGTVAMIGAPNANSYSGVVYVYGRSGTAWRLQSALTDPGTTHDDGFGSAIAISGNSTLIGAENADATAGTAYIYVHSASGWTLQATLPDTDGLGKAEYGSTVALSGGTALIGAPRLFGVVDVYVRSGTTWQPEKSLTDPAGQHTDSFGSSVAMSGSTAIVGADGVRGNGAAYIYAESGTHWQLLHTMVAPHGGIEDDFGSNVAIVGGVAIIGARDVNNAAGAAYFYTGSASKWRQYFTVADAFGAPGPLSGWAVSISGSTAIVGAPGARQGVGDVGVFARSGTRWHQQAVLTDPHPVGGNSNYYGASVAVSGTTALIGVAEEGVVYAYTRSGSRWQRQATLTDGSDGALFGNSIAMSGTTAVIGEGDPDAGTSGALIYDRSASGWHLQTALPDPDQDSADAFGSSVAMSGSTVVVGAPDARKGAGAAYVYVGSSSGWRLQADLADPSATGGDGFGISAAISGATAVVGANGVGRGAGAAYVYVRSGSRWHLQAKLRNPRGVIGGGYGYSVAMSGTGRGIRTLVGGLSVSGLPTSASQCGRVFEYMRSGQKWHERARIVDPKCHSYDEYGFSVALSGRTAVIGVPGEGHNTGKIWLVNLP